FDAAPDGGWTIKDILGHLAVWNGYLAAVLDGRGGPEVFEITVDEPDAGEDALNERLVGHWSALSLDEVWDRYVASRLLVRERIAAMDPALLGAPFLAVAPESPVADDSPLPEWLTGAVVNHVDEHLPRVMMLADALTADATVAGELERFDRNYAVIAEVVDGRLASHDGRIDAGGWSVADNLSHLAAWNRELLAMIRREPVHERVGVPPEVWAREDETEINAAIHAANRGRSAESAWLELLATNAALRDAISGLGDADLRRPRSDFDLTGGTMSDLPLLRWVRSCGDFHLHGHLPAIAALLGS
ncbi:MAG: DinB family protein, partial [Thermomicrobiales bacterium]